MTRRSDKAGMKTVAVENILPGTVLHLGDGRRIAFGESAVVSEEIARLIKPAQAKKQPR